MAYILFFIGYLEELLFMKKNILLLSFCLFLSSCYINKFDEFSKEFQPTLDATMWTPITSFPLFVDTTVPYIVYTGTDKIVYIYKNKKNQLIYLEHKQNTTRQYNISDILTPGTTISKLVYTEFDSRKVIGLLDSTKKFKSYIIHNNFNTTPQYDLPLTDFGGDRLYLHFHSASKGNLLYSSSAVQLSALNLTPSADPPIHAPSDKVAPAGSSYTALTRNKNSLALYYNADRFKTYNFTDGSAADGPSFTAGLTMFMFSLQEGNDIWVTTTTSGKMNIYKVRVQNNGTIPSTTLIGSDLDTLANGFIAKGEGSGYFMAAQTVAGGQTQIIKTSDNFNTMENLGTVNTTTSEFKSVGGVPYLSYVTATGELVILKYSNNDSSHGGAPYARISIDSTSVPANIAFSVSASASSGNNLRYFWNVSPNTGAIIEDPTRPTTRITLPPGRVTISLEVNNGFTSSRATQVVTAS